ncbi:MAG: hypothetical protein SFU53_04000 [Terrimicrobiaceae bacterium]|nr:hypothetical protein [Terrimicrobiaceae bacterium]
MRKNLTTIGVAFEVLAIVVGLYLEFAPSAWPNFSVPAGMGLVLVAVSVAMIPVIIENHVTANAILEAGNIERLLLRGTGRAAAHHERDFYASWQLQLQHAKNNADVTHLGVYQPSGFTGDGKEYFKNIKKIVKKCPAHVRRVERLTVQKAEWLRTLTAELSGLENFSLSVLDDPSDEDLPAAVSVCRIDDNVAWLIALAEHESTTEHRDISITDPDCVRIISRYFQKRLWDRATVVISHGTVVGNIDALIARKQPLKQ